MICTKNEDCLAFCHIINFFVLVFIQNVCVPIFRQRKNTSCLFMEGRVQMLWKFAETTSTMSKELILTFRSTRDLRQSKLLSTRETVTYKEGKVKQTLERIDSSLSDRLVIDRLYDSFSEKKENVHQKVTYMIRLMSTLVHICLATSKLKGKLLQSVPSCLIWLLMLVVMVIGLTTKCRHGHHTVWC